MKRQYLFLLLLLCGSLSATHAQPTSPALLAVQASPLDYSTKVLHYASEVDTPTLLLRLHAWQPFQGQVAFNPYAQQLQLIGVGSDGRPNGLWVDVASTRLLAQYAVEGSLLDIQYDLRQRTWWALRQLPAQQGYSLVKWIDSHWELQHELEEVHRILPQAIAFDHNRGLYVFVGQDAQGVRRLYRWDTHSGEVFDRAPTEDFLFEGLCIDLKDDKLYGIARKRSNVGQYFFVEINPTTAFPTIIVPFVGVEAIASHTASFDQSAGVYAVVTQRNDKPWEVQEIDVLEGITIRRRPIGEGIKALFISNAAFGESQYKD